MQHVISTVFPFIGRTLLIHMLSASYAGLGGLFSSVLSILSLAELGISNAIVYSMYKPVAEGDDRTVCALLAFYRKAYRVISMVILLLGLLLLPFLRFLIHGEIPDDVNIYFLFGVYLLNTIVSYAFFGYMSCILAVNQRTDILSRISIISRVALQILQCALIIAFRNYSLYVVVMPLGTVCQNLLNRYWAAKLYPQYRPEGILDASRYTDLKKRVSGLLIWKIGAASRTTFDSIVISAYLGLTTVAMYNNYWLVINTVNAALAILSSSMQAGVGNKIAVTAPEENYRDFRKFHFIYMWISGWCTVCLMCLFQPMMKQWMGTELSFPYSIVLLYCYLFFKQKEGDIPSVYYQAAGLWWEGRWRSVIEAVSNLVLNLILGRFLGVAGILLATIISCNIAYFYGAKFVFVCYFRNDGTKRYYLENLVYLSATAIGGGLTLAVIQWMNLPGGIVRNVVLVLLCLVIPNLVFLGIYSLKSEKRNYIRYGMDAGLRLFGRKK